MRDHHEMASNLKRGPFPAFLPPSSSSFFVSSSTRVIRCKWQHPDAFRPGSLLIIQRISFSVIPNVDEPGSKTPKEIASLGEKLTSAATEGKK